MASSMMLARALADGGTVVWDPPERPRLRVAAAWAARLRDEAGDVRAVLERAVCFRRQAEATRHQAALPCFVLPSAPTPRAGFCISCGTAVSRGWRCARCLVAVYIALEAVPPGDLECREDPAETL